MVRRCIVGGLLSSFSSDDLQSSGKAQEKNQKLRRSLGFPSPTHVRPNRRPAFSCAGAEVIIPDKQLIWPVDLAGIISLVSSQLSLFQFLQCSLTHCQLASRKSRTRNGASRNLGARRRRCSAYNQGSISGRSWRNSAGASWYVKLRLRGLRLHPFLYHLFPFSRLALLKFMKNAVRGIHYRCFELQGYITTVAN